MATFMSLPFELRCQIYSYLLIDINVAAPDFLRDPPLDVSLWPCGLVKPQIRAVGRRRLYTQFSVALFRVSKQLSEETLEFFYSKNKFVSFHGLSSFIEHDASGYFPAIRITSRSRREGLTQIQNVAVEVEVAFRDGCLWVGNKASGHRQNETYVFSARHLPILVALWNYGSFSASAMGGSSVFSFHFRVRSGKYDYSRGSLEIETIVSQLKELRNRGESEDETEAGEAAGFLLSGDLGEDLNKDLADPIRQPLTSASWIATRRYVIQEANNLQASGFLFLARQWYKAAMRFLESIRGNPREPPYEYEVLLTEILSQMGIGACKMELYALALWNFYSSVPAGKRKGFRKFTGQQLRASLLLHWQVYLEGSNLQDTLEAYDKALSHHAQYLPSDVRVSKLCDGR